MKDIYPRLDTLPHEWLVEPEDQPDYLDVPGVRLDEGVDLGSMLCDVPARAGLGGATAIVHHESGRSLTFSELSAVTDRAAAAFAGLGIRPGDRVALRGGNGPELIIAAIATWKIGAVVTLIPPLARAAEVEFFLADTQPRLLVLTQPESDEIDAIFGQVAGLTVVCASEWDALLEGAGPRPDVPADLDRVAIVWHTGGTTGLPKGCYHTQRRFLLGGLSLGMATGAAPGQRWAAAAPMGHALGFIHSTNFTLLNGVTLVVVSNFAKPAVMLEALARHEVTQFTAIAATWAGMLESLAARDAPEPAALTRGFAMWQSSSASDVAAGWRQRGIELLNNFGSTAFATWVLVPPLDRPVPQACLGRPAPGYEVLAIDPDLSQGPRPVIDRRAGPDGRARADRPDLLAAARQAAHRRPVRPVPAGRSDPLRRRRAGGLPGPDRLHDQHGGPQDRPGRGGDGPEQPSRRCARRSSSGLPDAHPAGDGGRLRGAQPGLRRVRRAAPRAAGLRQVRLAPLQVPAPPGLHRRHSRGTRSARSSPGSSRNSS